MSRLTLKYRGAEVVQEFKDGQLVWQSPTFEPSFKPETHYIMGDIAPYKSMIDGSYVGSRSTHKEHLKQHGCIEIGNETNYLKAKPLESPKGLKDTLVRVTNEKLR